MSAEFKKTVESQIAMEVGGVRVPEACPFIGEGNLHMSCALVEPEVTGNRVPNMEPGSGSLNVGECGH